MITCLLYDGNKVTFELDFLVVEVFEKTGVVRILIKDMTGFAA